MAKKHLWRIFGKKASPQQTIRQIAYENNIRPNDVHQCLQAAY